MTNSKAELLNIKKRFNDQCDSLARYIDLMENITDLPKWSRIQYVIDILKKYHLFTDSCEEEKYEDMLTNDPGKLMSFFKNCSQDLNDKISHFEGLLNLAKESRVLEKNENNEMNDAMDESIMQYIRFGFYDEKNSIEEIQELQDYFDNENKALLLAQNKLNKEYVEDYNKKINEEKFILLKNTFVCEILEYNLSILQEIVRDLERFDVLVKVNDEENVLNVYRQGFILLIAGFDASIFDMIKVLLTNKFFEYIANFNKEGKIKLQDMSNYNNFENLRDEIIISALRGKYIKDLLEILKKLDVQHVNEHYSNLIECVKRRNIHLHNQGKVDAQYLENCNIFGFTEGKIAKIDSDYLVDVFELCDDTIESIYNWINVKI
ncbi:hypothetical protein KPL47_15055 [Clostridium estertheticum]|uniref:hypothetical protein n=1 Tax=Clostridium estertheticum TaxID=238834 RepID=UPI001C0CDAAC|nr:hypothetical protein [Clostridium estertheticum]MBU3177651.1 hypothetical protein [Clostridium estertheticum]